jgi:hypothetical protein
MENQNIEEFTPEKMAEVLFSQHPKDPLSICLLPFTDKLPSDEIAFNFEILMTIYMEGVIDVYRLVEMLSNNTIIDRNTDIYKQKINIHDINIDVLELLKPWFLSFGYILNVTEYENYKGMIDDFNLKNYYCKIVLRDNPDDYGFFYHHKKINKPYHFLMNGGYDNEFVTDIKQLKALCFLPKNKSDPNSKDKVFSIGFSFAK